MHLLETNASTSALQWFMDSPIIRKSDEKSSMIKTPSRIHTSLPSHLGSMDVGGSCFPATHCRVFSKVTTGYPSDAEYVRRISSSSSPEQRQSPDEIPEQPGSNENEGDREVPTSPQSGDESRIHHRRLIAESNLNGFINGFIMQTRPKDKRSPSPVPPSHITPSTFRRVKIENNNSNNNRLPCENAAENDEKLPKSKSDRENCKKNAGLPFVKDYLEYRRPDDSSDKEQEKMLNGSDILRRMYASFGSKPSDGQGLVGPSNQRNQESKLVKRCENEGKSHSKMQNQHTSHEKSDDGPNNSVIPKQDSREANDFFSAHDGDVHDRHTRTPDNGSNVNDHTTKRTSPHSIESLLSNHQVNLNDEKLLTPRESRKSQQDKARDQRITPPKRRHEKSGDREKHLTTHSDTEERGFISSPKSRRVSERDIYNEKSREIFRQDKEVIENSLRQNQGLPFIQHPHDAALHPPSWPDASALAAFQANFLSSFPQNGVPALSDPSILLKSASLAAAVSANPLLLSSNPYLVNPYILRGLGSSEVAAAAAYHQAMAQGLLQSHASINPLLNSGVLGNPSFPQGLNPFMCGLGDTSTLAAAIAASVRPQAAGIYPNVPYANVPQRRDQMNEVPRPHIGPNRVVSSPEYLRLRPKRLSSETATTVQSSEKQRGESGEVRNVLTGRKSDSTFKMGGNMKNSVNIPKPPVHSSAQAFLQQKRKDSSPSSPDLLPPKRKTCATGSDFIRKNNLKDFIPNPLIKSPKNKNGDGPKTIPLSCEKSPKNSEKISASKPCSYKNLTRERRLVANARERTRVHTISSAFEELRQQIPSYSCNQKLSKLAILRIACSYIQSLSVLAGRSTEGTFKESVDQCTRVLQAESRARSRRKNNKAQIEWEVANYEKGSNSDVEVKKKSSDSLRSSRGTTLSIYHNVSTVDSSHNDEDAQVGGEDVHRKTACDSPEPPRDSMRDGLDNTQRDHFNDSGDQSRHNLAEESTLTESDSLDSGNEQIKASSDARIADSSTLEHRKLSPQGNTTGRNNAPLHYPSGSLERDKIESSVEENELDKNDKFEDPQNDLINVED